MNRNRWMLVLAGALVLAALGSAAYYYSQPHLTRLAGDAWDYTLLPDKEMPTGWVITSQGAITPHDVAQESVETNAPLTQSVSLARMTQIYFASYNPPETSEFASLSVEIILYQSTADAQAALAPETPGAEWEKITAARVGDETQAWHFINPPDATGQNIYRVDFSYLNGIASLTLIGTDKALPNVDEALRYARLIQQKMVAKAVPAELKRLRAAQLSDLRARLLSQTQIAEIDQYLGGRWQLDTRLLAGWTPNSSFDADTQAALDKVGRVTGYQMFLTKALSANEKKLALAEAMFQQVTAYPNAATAKQMLGQMSGLPEVPELPAPEVGDGARAWSGVTSSTGADGAVTNVAACEVTFRVGQYIASVRLQSRALSVAEKDSAPLAVYQFALKLAQTLAANLK